MGSLKSILKWFLSPSLSNEIYLVDNEHNLEVKLGDIISELEYRIEQLESENIETTNQLYEIQNKLDMILEQNYNLKNFSLGDS